MNNRRSLHLLAEAYKQVYTSKARAVGTKYNEAETPGVRIRSPKESDVLRACNEYVKSISNDDMSKYLVNNPENIYNIAFELTHDDMVSDDDSLLDDEMADAELDSEEVAVKACEGIAKYTTGAMLFSITPEQSFDLVYSIARLHMPN